MSNSTKKIDRKKWLINKWTKILMLNLIRPKKPLTKDLRINKSSNGIPKVKWSVKPSKQSNLT